MNPPELTPQARDLIQAGRVVVRTKHYFDFSKRQCVVKEMPTAFLRKAAA